MMEPKKLSKSEIIFATDVSDLMPKNIPENFYNYNNPYCQLVDKWFFQGLTKSKLKVKNGINQEDAFGHMSAIMGSFDLSYGDKIAAVAYLMSMWFDIV